MDSHVIWEGERGVALFSETLEECMVFLRGFGFPLSECSVSVGFT